jgi:Flp pilus assembly protein TadB
MESILNSDFAPFILAGFAALAFAALGYWVAWISTSLGEEAQTFDSRQLGLLILMLPIARRLGNYSEAIRLMPLQQYEKWAARNLNLSGLNDYFSPREYVGSHLAMFLLGVTLPLFLLLYPDAQVGQVLALSLVLGIILFFMPFIVLNDIIKKRRHAIFKALPYFLDLVTLLVESGWISRSPWIAPRNSWARARCRMRSTDSLTRSNWASRARRR